MRRLITRRLVATLATSVGCLGLVVVAPMAHASKANHHKSVGAVKMACRRAPFSVTQPAPQSSLVQQGQPAPRFKAERLDCGKYTLADAQGQGHVTFINFFASWCEYCIAEAPDLVKFYKTYHRRGLNAVGVDTADDGTPPGDPSLFYKKFHFPFVSVWDAAAKGNGTTDTVNGTDEIWNAYATQPAVACIPTTFFLHEDGTIAVIAIGQMSPQAMVQNYKWAKASQAADENDPNYLAYEAQNTKCSG